MTSFLRPHIALILICLIFCGTAVFALHDLSIYNPDSTRYLVWAKSLAGFHGFRDYTSPEGEQYVVHAPLYALVLAPVSFLLGGSIIALKIWTLCFGIVGIVLMYRWVGGTYGRPAALTAAILLAANSLYWLYSTEILSEAPFFALMILFFVLSDRLGDKLARGEESGASPVGSLIWLGVVLAACMLMREIGIALVLCSAAHALWKRDVRRMALSLEIPGALYLLWWLRNEFIVGGREQPALTNAKMFSRRYYTIEGDPFVKELIARIGANVSVYIHRIGEALFLPMYNQYMYDVVYRSTPAVMQMYGAVRALAPLFVIIACGFVAAGIYRDYTKSKTFSLKILFLIFYLAILCCYPINDSRFLLPLLGLMIYFFAAGILWAAEISLPQSKPGLAYAMCGLAIVLSIPNMSWNAEYVSAVNSYHRYFLTAQAGGGASEDQPLQAGSVFARPFKLAGDWIALHSTPNIVIVSQLKDIAYWVGERKVLNLNETISVGDFDDYLRDYDVTFLVAAHFANGMREFEYQMDISPRYSFDLVYHVGALDVFHVIRHPKGWRNASPPDTSTAFLRGLACLRNRDYDGAKILLERVLNVDTLNYAALFFKGIADEFAGQSTDALDDFSRFQHLPQAGMYLDASQIHETYVQSRAIADVAQDIETRSQILLELAGAYWQQGFHAQAQDLLAQIFRADSSDLGAYAFGIYFAVDDGEGALAREYLRSAQKRFASEKVIQEYGRYFAVADSLNAGLDSARRGDQLLALGAELHEIGVEHAAADILLQVVDRYPANREAAKMLDSIYEKERRFAPAARILQIHLAADPGDTDAKNALSEVEGIIE